MKTGPRKGRSYFERPDPIGTIYVCSCGRKFTKKQAYFGHKGHCPVPRGVPREAQLRGASNGGKAKSEAFRPILLEELLVENSHKKSSYIKYRLIEEGVKEHRCEVCLLETWNGVPIPIELHHMNGVKHDNRIENLQILCPNCHAQTSTYCVKNWKTKRT